MNGNELRALLSYNIKLHRGYHGWSQADLAEKANISINFLSSIERGVKWPHPDTLVKIAKALRIEGSELFYKKEPMIDDTVALIDRLVKDIKISVDESIDKTYQNYYVKTLS